MMSLQSTQEVSTSSAGSAAQRRRVMPNQQQAQLRHEIAEYEQQAEILRGLIAEREERRDMLAKHAAAPKKRQKKTNQQINKRRRKLEKREGCVHEIAALRRELRFAQLKIEARQHYLRLL